MDKNLLHGELVRVKDSKILGVAVQIGDTDNYTILVQNTRSNIYTISADELERADERDVRFTISQYFPSDHDGLEGPYGTSTMMVEDNETGGVIAYVDTANALEMLYAIRIGFRQA